MKIAIAIVVAFSASFCGLGAAHAQEFVLNLAHIHEIGHPIHHGALRFKEVAEERSGGRIKVNVFSGTALGDSRELELQVQAGALFGMIDPTTKTANFVPSYGIFDLPFLANDEEQVYKLFDDPRTRKLILDRSVSQGFRFVHLWEVTFRHIYTSEKPVSSIADIHGMKIRVIPAPSYLNLFKALGASPTPMDFGELYTALQQGVVDGAENDIITYLNSKHNEVAPHLAMTNHMMLVLGLIVSEKLWQTYPDDVRQIINDASLEARKVVVASAHKETAMATGEMTKKGVKITKPDRTPFIKAAKTTYGWFEQTYGKDVVAELLEIAEQSR